MKKKLVTAAFAMTLLLTGCGSFKEYRKGNLYGWYGVQLCAV